MSKFIINHNGVSISRTYTVNDIPIRDALDDICPMSWDKDTGSNRHKFFRHLDILGRLHLLGVLPEYSYTI
jgi:hypothetical protein